MSTLVILSAIVGGIIAFVIVRMPKNTKQPNENTVNQAMSSQKSYMQPVVDPIEKLHGRNTPLFCSKCGTKLNPMDSFCVECGEKVNRDF